MCVCVCGLCKTGTLKHTPAECGGTFHNVLARSLVGARPVDLGLQSPVLQAAPIISIASEYYSQREKKS